MKLTIGKWAVRSYEANDLATIVKYGNNRNIWQNLTNRFPSPYTAKDAEWWLKHVQSQQPETNFAIASAQEYIGGIGFEFLEDVHCKTAAIGYWLGEPFWRQGIMTGVLKAVTDYAFTQHDLVRIQAGVFDYNPASGRVLAKAGYTLEARLRQHVFEDGKVADLLLYARLREEWQHIKG